ncbi:MAG: glycosyltransferase family 25 protein [Allorhizobium sp.]
MDIEALVIHLGRAEMRREHVGTLLSSLPLRASVIDAVDGQALSSAEVSACYHPGLHRPSYPFALSRNEVACFLSHRKAWQAIVDRNLDAALIMEDDAAPTAAFAPSLALALKHILASGLIRFPFRDGREFGRTLAKADGASLIQPELAGLGMVAQLVSNNAAAQLLRATEHFDRPVDTMMQMPWITGVTPRSVVPGGIFEISSTMGGTTLCKSSRGALAKLKQEMLRPLYRAKLKMWMRRAAAPLAVGGHGEDATTTVRIVSSPQRAL